MGRIKPGVNETQVRAELDVIFNQSIDAMIRLKSSKRTVRR
jgi:hypothetical protein